MEDDVRGRELVTPSEVLPAGPMVEARALTPSSVRPELSRWVNTSGPSPATSFLTNDTSAWSSTGFAATSGERAELEPAWETSRCPTAVEPEIVSALAKMSVSRIAESPSQVTM